VADTFLQVSGSVWLNKLLILHEGGASPRPLIEAVGRTARIWMTDVTLQVCHSIAAFETTSVPMVLMSRVRMHTGHIRMTQHRIPSQQHNSALFSISLACAGYLRYHHSTLRSYAIGAVPDSPLFGILQ
jgi:hypothetical protein